MLDQQRFEYDKESMRRGRARGRARGQPSTADKTADHEQELCHPKGQLKACLLLLVSTRPAHGYELIASVEPFGYAELDPAPVYRSLRWLEEAGLLQANWDVGGGGPARRVFSVTPEGSRLAQVCATTLQERAERIQHQLGAMVGGRSSQGSGRRFDVFVEATLSVAADDAESAMRTVNRVLGKKHRLAPAVWTTGQGWVYEATSDKAG